MANKKTQKGTLSDAELMQKLEEARATLRTERFAAAGARPKDSNAPRKLRKEIARLLTERAARTRKIT